MEGYHRIDCLSRGKLCSCRGEWPFARRHCESFHGLSSWKDEAISFYVVLCKWRDCHVVLPHIPNGEGLLAMTNTRSRFP